MKLVHSATWWSLFMIPAVLIPISWSLGLVVLTMMSLITLRLP